MKDTVHASDHLLVLVHGIMSSPNDWINFGADLKRRLGNNFMIHASSCNMYFKTLDGVDVAGTRLAVEVTKVVTSDGNLKKISFVSHSLGGLIARYAVGILYHAGTIAGLKPMNFITLATPHLGVRGNKQLPFVLGVGILEKLAALVSPLIIRKTGRQLFFTDGINGKPPLLLRMTTDHDEGKFISALSAFESRVVYANVSYDYMVGWRTASIRRETETIQLPPRLSMEGYKHIVNIEECPSNHHSKPKEGAQTPRIIKYYERIEEEMVKGLHRVVWTKVDINFGLTLEPFMAHGIIIVRHWWLHKAGAEVVEHVAHIMKQHEAFDNLNGID